MDLETDNPDKGQLLQKSAHHRELLEQEVKLISERSEKIITNALVIGGALALTYFLVSGFSSSKKRKRKARKIKLVQSADQTDTSPEAVYEPQEPGIVSQIGTALAAQATGLLLSIAKEKLQEYLKSQSAKKENTNERS
jgi:hypothetical protein